MPKIVHQLRLIKGTTIDVNVYGHGTKSKTSNRLMYDHWKVGEETVNIVTIENAKQRKHHASKSTTNDLRDIKDKIGSGDKTDKKAGNGR